MDVRSSVALVTGAASEIRISDSSRRVSENFGKWADRIARAAEKSRVAVDGRLPATHYGKRTRRGPQSEAGPEPEPKRVEGKVRNAGEMGGGRTTVRERHRDRIDSGFVFALTRGFCLLAFFTFFSLSLFFELAKRTKTSDGERRNPNRGFR